MSKISVIVPAYNTGSKIRECIESILNQTHKDLELILVDDCSKDNTYEVMCEYAEKDSRVIAVRNPINGGAGRSRNVGIELSTGEYVTFVDSDDYLDLDTYSAVNDAINLNNSPDIIRFDQNSFLDLGRVKVSLNFFTNNVYNGKNGILIPRREQRYVSLETPGVCNKVFKRELIGDTRFVEGMKWEDYPFCTFLLAKANEVVFVRKGGYNYRHSLKCDNTTLGDVKKPSERMLEIYDCCDMLSEEYKEAGIFEQYEFALRSNQKIHSLQRVRDVMFSKAYPHEEKKELINALLNLTEVKYGKVFNDPMYRSLKSEKVFYRTRMGLVERVYSDPSLRTSKSETEIRSKIKTMI